MSIREDLKAYIDGELAPVRAEQVRIALEADPKLHKEYTDLVALSSCLSGSTSQVDSVGLEDTLRALNRSQSWGWQKWQRPIWSAGLALAAVCVIFLILPELIGQSSQSAKMAMKSDAAAISAPAVAAAPQMDQMVSKSTSADSAKQPMKPEMLQKTRSETFKSFDARPVAKSKQADQRSLFAIPKKAPMGFVEGAVTTERTKDSLPLQRPSRRDQSTPLSDGPTLTRASVGQPQTVVLAFDSQELGTKQVQAMVGKYAVKDTATLKGSTGTITLPTSIVVDLPEDIADKTINDLKGLADPPATSLSPAPSGAYGGPGGPGGPARAGMGGGGFGGSRFGGGSGRGGFAAGGGVAGGLAPTGKSENRSASGASMAKTPVDKIQGVADLAADLPKNAHSAKVEDSQRKGLGLGVRDSAVALSNRASPTVRGMAKAKAPWSSVANDRKQVRRVIILLSQKPKPPQQPVP